MGMSFHRSQIVKVDEGNILLSQSWQAIWKNMVTWFFGSVSVEMLSTSKAQSVRLNNLW